MSQVVRMLEADEYPNREDRRNKKSRTTSMEFEIMKESTALASVGDQSSRVGDIELESQADEAPGPSSWVTMQ